ncbi:MAG: CARDB domain-containing protein, partial [Bacteroidia bacterium]
EQKGLVLTHPKNFARYEKGQWIFMHWDDYEAHTNNYELSYSINNGNSWTIFNDTIPFTERGAYFQLPSGISGNQVKFKVARKGTSIFSSSLSLVVSERVGGLSSQGLCTDYSQLKWNTVQGAIGYKVFALDTIMKMVNYTTDTIDTVALNKDANLNWFAVAPVFNNYTGLRCNAVNANQVQGNSCPFKDDLSADVVLGPKTGGRKDYPNELSNSETIKVRVVNKGTNNLSNFKIYYQINNNSAVSETYSSTLNSATAINYSFATKANLSNAGEYAIKAWTEYANDTFYLNDTADLKIVKQAENNVVSLPLIQPFSSYMNPQEITDSTISINGYEAFDYAGSGAGRIKHSTYNFGMGLESSTNSIGQNELTWNLNLSNYTNRALCLDFKFIHFNERDHPEDRVWIRGSKNDSWLELIDLNQLFTYDISEQQQELAPINIYDFLLKNNQNVSSTTQIRFGQKGSSPMVFTNIFNFQIANGGYCIDDLRVSEMGPDLILDSIISPVYYNDGYVNNTEIKIKVRNTYHQAITNVPVSYQFEGHSAVNESIASIPANSEMVYTFSTRYNYTAHKLYNIKSWVGYAQDTFNTNDTLQLEFFNNLRQYGYPYSQNFETSSGYFWVDGENASWDWGTPQANDISSAAQGSKCWVTNLTSVHNTYEQSYLNTPAFYTSSFGNDDMILSFQLAQFTRYTHIEYSINEGDFQKLGNYDGGVNWYNDSNNVAFNTNNGWRKYTYQVPNALFKTAGKIRFRIVFNGNTGVNFGEGVGIDDFKIEKAGDDVALVELLSPFTNCGLGNSESVQIKVANLSSGNLTNIPIKFRLSGNSVVSETIGQINSGDTITYTFNAKADLSTQGNYNISVYTDLGSDANPLNDSISDYTFTSKPIISSLPYIESFENGPAGWHAEGQNSSWQHGTPTNGNNPSTAVSGNKVWATNLNGNHNQGEISYLVSPCFDFSNVTNNPFLEFQHAFNINGWAEYYLEYSEDGSSWNKLGENGSNNTWYNESDYFDGYEITWRKARIEIPLQSISDSSSVKFRFVMYSAWNNWNLAEGIALDSIMVYEIKNDLALKSVFVQSNGCGLSASEKLFAVIKNNSGSSQSNFQVKYKINSGSIVSNSISVSIAAGATDTIELSNAANLSSRGVYNVQAWVNHSFDNYANNDSVQVSIISSAVVSSYPYTQDFESGNGGWFTDGDLWEVGVPNNTNISASYGGTKALVTDLDGQYRNNDT